MTTIDAPVEMTWGPDGVTFSTVLGNPGADAVARRHVQQERLRTATWTATHPAISVRQLARLSGLSEGTLYAFMSGRRTLQPDVAVALAAALERFQGGDA